VRRLPLVLIVLVLTACTAETSPRGFEGISTSNPHDLPAVGPFVEGRPGPNGGTILGPVSQPIDEAVAYRFSLGHCGLLSPIDVDGSLWDALDGTTPAGADLDLDADSEMINATGGVVVVIGDEMRFRTDSGSVVRFERHVGEKEYPGCD
jgi:hypothetical protein